MTWPSGRSRYNLAILAELRTFRPVPYALELDGETWQTEAMLVAVGNGSSYGGGMRVCPDARLDDGLLDVTVLGPISKLGVPPGVPDRLQGHPRRPPGGHRAPGPPGQRSPRRVSRRTPTASGCRCCRCTSRRCPARCGSSQPGRSRHVDWRAWPLPRSGTPTRGAAGHAPAPSWPPSRRCTRSAWTPSRCGPARRSRPAAACWSPRPTGAGKTVVGEFAVHLALAEGRKCFYTTPIKALSNQKYADLVAPLRRRPRRPAHRRQQRQRRGAGRRHDHRGAAQHALRRLRHPRRPRLRRDGRGALPLRPVPRRGLGGGHHPPARVGARWCRCRRR